MSFFLKSSLFISFLCSFQIVFSQFEKVAVRNISTEYEKDLLEDSTSTYVKLMLCGDLIHRSQLVKRYAQDSKGNFNYRTWFRQVKPLLFYPDFVVGSLRSFFPNRTSMNTYPNSAPDEYLAELEYTGFNVLMMANTEALTDRPKLNEITLNKLDYFDLFKAGYYKDSMEKAAEFPLVLEKKDIRVGFLNYSLDSVLLDLPQHNINFFRIDSVRKDVMKARNTMLADYIIAYIDWAGLDSTKLGIVVELMNMGIDVVIGTGNGESFTTADLLTYSNGSIKLHIDNIGYFNAESNERERDKTAIIEIVLKKNKTTKAVSTHDMGFIPIWTLIDHERYAVLPISNMEEKHIQNINLNLIQYSTMKVAFTDLRYAFYDKIPELHYDFNDKTVSAVEQTGFIRKTLMREQVKINSVVKNNANKDYASLFGSPPPPHGSLDIPYDDIWGIYSKKERKEGESVRDSVEWYGYDVWDEFSPRGILNVKANHDTYQRTRVRPLTDREKFVIDSINKYNARFIIVDSIAEKKKMIKQKLKDSMRIRDSIFQASLDPNYISTYRPKAEKIDKSPVYKPKIKSGVYTEPEFERESNKEPESPVKNIEEFFIIQIYALSSKKPLDVISYPYLSGYEIKYEEGYYRYYIGRTNSKNLAIELLKSIQAKGHTDAILVKYTNGVRRVVQIH